MQNHKRRQYTDEFKQEAVCMITDRGYSASDTAKRLGINTNMLRRRLRAFFQAMATCQRNRKS